MYTPTIFNCPGQGGATVVNSRREHDFNEYDKGFIRNDVLYLNYTGGEKAFHIELPNLDDASTTVRRPRLAMKMVGPKAA